MRAMKESDVIDNATGVRAALDALEPSRFGMRRYKEGWLLDDDRLGTIAFAPLAWQHAQSPAEDRSSGTSATLNALGLVVRLQEFTWGFPPEETVPINVLATVHDAGGGVLVAYESDKGFTSDSWLGFAIGFGASNGVLYSHMLGVREDARGTLDLGWRLKVLQAYEAVKSGHHAMTWTYDPMRGANARLNLEKLKATIAHLTLDKYGVMRSSLYGNVPTDRFTAVWDLLDPSVHQRLFQICHREWRPLTLDQIADLPQLTIETRDHLDRERPTRFSYEIPGDIDRLAREDPERAIRWRQEMRELLRIFMTTRWAERDDPLGVEGPIAVSIEQQTGDYIATGFATGIGEDGERRSFYVLQRKGDS
jgi:chorismate synthase